MKNNNYKKYLLIALFGIIFASFGGTLSFLLWKTSEEQKTEITFTVTKEFSCSVDGGGNITNETKTLMPTSSCTHNEYAIQKTITVTPTINNNTPITMNLWLDINEIGTNLSNSQNLKYALTTDPNSCTNGLIQTGDFYGLSKNDSVSLFNNMRYNNTTTDTYYLYIWIDSQETNNKIVGEKIDLSLNGVCKNKPPAEKNVLYNLVESFAVPDNKSSKFVTNSSGINFENTSGERNGKGVYTIADTINKTYPVHYYRGPVKDNNVIFANYCWKIVRTTETGGTKLIYNGPVNNGKCNNTGTISQLEEKSEFNTTKKIEASGYSYGPIHTLESKTITNIPNQTIFSNNVTYDETNKKYILSNERYIKDDNLNSSNLNENLKNHHYTCFTTDANNCANEVYFVYMARDISIFYVKLTNGENIEEMLYNVFENSSNTTSSKIKEHVDNWYASNMTDYTKYLEDTIWCNDRSIYSANGWSINGNILDVSEEKLNFSANDRLVNRKKPSLYCKNLSDRFTVSKDNGNGALTYPVALITLDEAALAGYVWFVNSSNNYLNTDTIWWTMTPTIASANLMYISILYSIADNVQSDYTRNGAGGIRPVISLKYGTTITSGVGTVNYPYIIDENL